MMGRIAGQNYEIVTEFRLGSVNVAAQKRRTAGFLGWQLLEAVPR
jgi:hypothetical protein